MFKITSITEIDKFPDLDIGTLKYRFNIANRKNDVLLAVKI